MKELKKLLLRLDRLLLGSKPKKTKFKRNPIFESDNLPAFYKDLELKFGLEFSAFELRKIDGMDDLVALIRSKHLSKTGDHINAHAIWGSPQRLAEKNISA